MDIKNKIKQLNDAASKQQFSGVVTIREGNTIIFEKAFGYRDISNHLKNNSQTRFGIASGTKLFTALGIGKLIDQEKISLDSKALELVDYNFPKYSNCITIQQLLTHTSGIPDYYDEELIEDFDHFKLSIPWDELIEPEHYFPVFPDRCMKFSPGLQFSYSNGGYVLLAAIIAKVSGLKYRDYIKEYVFKPMGMKHSGFFMMNQLPENVALGYIKTKDSWKTNIYNLPIVGGGDGGAYTTGEDLYKMWDHLLSGKMLSKRLTELFIKPWVQTKTGPIATYYGHGVWMKTCDHNLPTLYITGSDAGVSFLSVLDRDRQITFSILSNSSDGAWKLKDILWDF